MREIWANLPAQGQCLYPLLRSTSDLLMMPKDLLLEEGIRADMCSSVSLIDCLFDCVCVLCAVYVCCGAVLCVLWASEEWAGDKGVCCATWCSVSCMLVCCLWCVWCVV